MIAPQWMGLALLGIAWVTAFMIAIDALIDAKAMLQRLAEWKRSLVEGTVVAPELAVHEVEQRVKQLDAPQPALVFFDRSHLSRVTGGAVTVGSETLEVKGGKQAEAWFDEATRTANAACPSMAEFDRHDALAQGAGGGIRTVRSSLRAGQKAWLVGTRHGSTFEASVVAAFDPRPWAKGRLVAITGLVLVNFAWVAAGTVLALWPPVFGHVSIAGAIVLIGHFLGMTPIAMAAREKSRTPAVAFIRGTWKRDAVPAALPAH
jgi:hypothetical protein